MECKRFAPYIQHLSYSLIGFGGSLANWKPYASVSRQVCGKLSKSCPKHWMRPMAEYYGISQKSIKSALIDSYNALRWLSAPFECRSWQKSLLLISVRLRPFQN